jgi:hypothetical protein
MVFISFLLRIALVAKLDLVMAEAIRVFLSLLVTRDLFRMTRVSHTWLVPQKARKASVLMLIQRAVPSIHARLATPLEEW